MGLLRMLQNGIIEKYVYSLMMPNLWVVGDVIEREGIMSFSYELLLLR
jgi:hypothetical protein